MDNNQLIVVKQLPIIEQQLLSVKAEVEAKVSTALSMVCTEDTVKTIKEVRAVLTKDFNAYEEARKTVKAQVYEPYAIFEKVYKDCITNIFKPADTQLKAKIDEVENELKRQTEAEIDTYFIELLQASNIDFVTFKSTGINITLSASKSSLKKQAKGFVDKIVDELALIDTQDNKAEILVEYKKSLNVAQAITTVSARHKAIEDEQKRVEEVKAAADAKAAQAQAVEKAINDVTPPPLKTPTWSPIIAPTVAPIADTIYSMTITVRADIEKMKAFKKFLIDGGYEYEQHK